MDGLMRGRGLICSTLLLLGSVISGTADNGWERQILSATEENDLTACTDRHYTQGIRLTYLSRDDALPRWLEKFSNFLPSPGLEVQARKFGIGVGQEIYTPADLKTARLITDDRPYAGWLFTSLTLQRRGEVSPAWLAKEDLRLDVGTLGPESLAEAAQKAAHTKKPRGWKNQLDTEVAFALRYQRRYRYQFWHEDRWSAEILPVGRLNGGTVDTSLGVGGMLRSGYHIPNEFEAATQPTATYYGVYLFSSADGQYVIRNIFLDGNTFVTSHHVAKEPLVAELRAGVTVVLKSIELTAAHTLRTREFTQQRGNDSYSTEMVTVKF